MLFRRYLHMPGSVLADTDTPGSKAKPTAPTQELTPLRQTETEES